MEGGGGGGTGIDCTVLFTKTTFAMFLLFPAGLKRATGDENV
jgi:hypothetical protein